MFSLVSILCCVRQVPWQCSTQMTCRFNHRVISAIYNVRSQSITRHAHHLMWIWYPTIPDMYPALSYIISDIQRMPLGRGLIRCTQTKRMSYSPLLPIGYPFFLQYLALLAFVSPSCTVAAGTGPRFVFLTSESDGAFDSLVRSTRDKTRPKAWHTTGTTTQTGT